MKILYKLTLLEQRYLDKYLELPEDTIDKLVNAGLQNGKAMDFVNGRMNDIWLEIRNGQEFQEDLRAECPFLT